MRGKPDRVLAKSEQIRITPAGAGKTLTLRPVRPLRADHPRRCGENREKLGDDAARCGSPPRMRGKHCDEEAVRMRDRITPAYAGKTDTTQRTKAIIKDHPRVCGENRVSIHPWMTT